MANQPLYINLWRIFRKQILTGEYHYGDAFPTERELETKYKCDRKTIRKALSLLQEEQLLVRIVGKGTFVNKPDIRLSLESVRGLSGLLKQEGIEITSNVLYFQKIKAGYRIAKIMGIDRIAEVYKCVRLRSTKEGPIAVETTYIKDVFPELTNFDFNIYSLYGVMENYGQIPTTVTEDIMAIELSENEAQYLNKEPGDPVYLVVDITENQYGEVIEYNRTYALSERFVLSTELV